MFFPSSYEFKAGGGLTKVSRIRSFISIQVWSLSEELKKSNQTKTKCRKTLAAFFTFLLGHMQRVANILSIAISHSKYASALTPSYVGGYEEHVIVRRQRKTTQKYYPYQLATTGWW